MQYKETIDYLYDLGFFSVKLGLERITELCEQLGNPQDKVKCVHIAGTNGKGSICTFLESILMKAGYKVGVYTSPYLVDFRERIRVNGKMISKDDVVRLSDKMKPFIKKGEHSFFEVITAMMFEYFAEQKVDFAIVEVGLGGRLDATNVITSPVVAVISDISLEHTEHLGDTIDKIAYEKAGIIKNGCNVVISPDNKGIEKVKEIAVERNCRVYEADELDDGYEISMKGDFQKANAGTAMKVIEILNQNNFEILKSVARQGLKEAYWPGRFDFIKDNLLVDCAHNPDGARLLVDELQKLGKTDVILITGVMQTKDVGSMAKEFERLDGEVIVTQASNERAANANVVAENFSKNVIVAENVDEALKIAQGMQKDNGKLIVCAGSIYVVGEVFGSLGIMPFE